MQPLSGKVRVECQKLTGFCDFSIFGTTLCWNPAVESSVKPKTQPLVFDTRPLFSLRGMHRTHQNLQKTISFRKCPEDCADNSFCLIRPFFREKKNKRKSPKNVKNCGFWRFFRVQSNPSQGIRLSSVKNWRFFAILLCPNLC